MADHDAPTRLPLIGDETDDPKLAATFDHVRSTMGRIPNLYRTLGHSPEILEAWLAFAWPLRNAATSDRKLRELVIMRTAQINTVDYEWRQHWPMALEAGVTPAQLEALADWPASAVFSEQERVVLRMTDELGAAGRIADSAWMALRNHFDDRQCVELVLTASFYSCVSRVLEGLQVPLEDSVMSTPPVDPTASTPHLEPFS
jgi:alkylhydroperoxidase family enzyme